MARLYHFTIPENLLPISVHGLKPHIHRDGDPNDDDAWMTFGQPCRKLLRRSGQLFTDSRSRPNAES